MITPQEIRNIRLAMGMTQEDWAKQLKVSVNTVSRWETGTQVPREMHEWMIRKVYELHGVVNSSR